MYIFPEMIDMGLAEGQTWPSPEHRVVAQNLGLCNPDVRERDRLTEICQGVIKIPQDRIKTVTPVQCREEFHIPC